MLHCMIVMIKIYSRLEDVARIVSHFVVDLDIILFTSSGYLNKIYLKEDWIREYF